MFAKSLFWNPLKTLYQNVHAEEYLPTPKTAFMLKCMIEAESVQWLCEAYNSAQNNAELSEFDKRWYAKAVLLNYVDINTVSCEKDKECLKEIYEDIYKRYGNNTAVAKLFLLHESPYAVKALARVMASFADDAHAFGLATWLEYNDNHSKYPLSDTLYRCSPFLLKSLITNCNMSCTLKHTDNNETIKELIDGVELSEKQCAAIAGNTKLRDDIRMQAIEQVPNIYSIKNMSLAMKEIYYQSAMDAFEICIESEETVPTPTTSYLYNMVCEPHALLSPELEIDMMKRLYHSDNELAIYYLSILAQNTSCDSTMEYIYENCIGKIFLHLICNKHFDIARRRWHISQIITKAEKKIKKRKWDDVADLEYILSQHDECIHERIADELIALISNNSDVLLDTERNRIASKVICNPTTSTSVLNSIRTLLEDKTRPARFMAVADLFNITIEMNMLLKESPFTESLPLNADRFSPVSPLRVSTCLRTR